MDKFRGYYIKLIDNDYIFCDTGKLVKSTWYKRPCGFCNKYNTAEGCDGCLVELASVMNACCGHGETEEAYVQFVDKSILRDRRALDYFNIGKDVDHE